MATSAGPRDFAISRLPLVIGSGPRCGLRIAIPSVARRHCEIAQQGLFLIVRAIGERDVRVNGRRITQAALDEGDRLMIGPVEFMFSREGTRRAEAPLINVRTKVAKATSAKSRSDR